MPTICSKCYVYSFEKKNEIYILHVLFILKSNSSSSEPSKTQALSYPYWSIYRIFPSSSYSVELLIKLTCPLHSQIVNAALHRGHFLPPSTQRRKETHPRSCLCLLNIWSFRLLNPGTPNLICLSSTEWWSSIASCDYDHFLSNRARTRAIKIYNFNPNCRSPSMGVFPERIGLLMFFLSMNCAFIIWFHFFPDIPIPQHPMKKAAKSSREETRSYALFCF